MDTTVNGNYTEEGRVVSPRIPWTKHRNGRKTESVKTMEADRKQQKSLNAPDHDTVKAAGVEKQDRNESWQTAAKQRRKHSAAAAAGQIGSIVEYIALPAILILIWYINGLDGTVGISIVPTVGRVLETFGRKLTDGSLLSALWISVVRVLTGYAIAAVLGISLGILIGLSSHFQRFTNLMIQILRPIPPIAWIPLAILVLGIGEPSKVFLIFLGGFFVILVNVIDGIRYSDDRLLEVARMEQLSRFETVRKVIIPGALPNIFTGLRVGINTCWTCVVAAELVASSSGIGYMISNARNYGQMDVIIVGMLTIGVVGKLMDMLLHYIESKVIYYN